MVTQSYSIVHNLLPAGNLMECKMKCLRCYSGFVAFLLHVFWKLSGIYTVWLFQWILAWWNQKAIDDHAKVPIISSNSPLVKDCRVLAPRKTKLVKKQFCRVVHCYLSTHEDQCSSTLALTVSMFTGAIKQDMWSCEQRNPQEHNTVLGQVALNLLSHAPSRKSIQTINLPRPAINKSSKHLSFRIVSRVWSRY